MPLEEKSVHSNTFINDNANGVDIDAVPNIKSRASVAITVRCSFQLFKSVITTKRKRKIDEKKFLFS